MGIPLATSSVTRATTIVATILVALLPGCGSTSRFVPEPPLLGEVTYEAISVDSECYLRIRVDDRGEVAGEFFLFEGGSDGPDCEPDTSGCDRTDVASGTLSGRVSGNAVRMTAEPLELDARAFVLQGSREGDDLVLSADDGRWTTRRFVRREAALAPTDFPSTPGGWPRYSVEFASPFVGAGQLAVSPLPSLFFPLVWGSHYRRLSNHPGWSRPDDAPGSAWMGTFANGWVWIDVYDGRIAGHHLSRIWFRQPSNQSSSVPIDLEGLRPGETARISTEDSWIVLSDPDRRFAVSGTVSRPE